MKSSVLIGLSRHRIGVDGEGVTTLVAFHGCPLRCQYCLNPKALSPNGVWKRYIPEELYNHVKQDDSYFRATGGGVTFGGSEPLISCKEILHFHKICRDKGHDWKITIETSLNVPKVFVEVLEGIVDHWIVDIKDMNPEIYKAYTREENRQVIENLQHLIYNKARLTAEYHYSIRRLIWSIATPHKFRTSTNRLETPRYASNLFDLKRIGTLA